MRPLGNHRNNTTFPLKLNHEHEKKLLRSWKSGLERWNEFIKKKTTRATCYCRNNNGIDNINRQILIIISSACLKIIIFIDISNKDFVRISYV